MKRNLLSEINAVKSRAEYNSRHDLNNRLREIEEAYLENLNYNGTFSDELLKYLPIATIACIESFFRSVYKELIDFGEPFSSKVSQFNQAKNVKFDFEIVNAIQSKTVTVGEFISHILPCNKLEDISSNMEILIGNKFFPHLKEFSITRYTQNEEESYFIDNSELTVKHVSRLFELRHIFCHEFATNLQIEKEEIIAAFSSAKTFLNVTNDFIWELLYPNAPQTQTDMNIHATEEFKIVEVELEELVLEVQEAFNEYSHLTMNLLAFDKVIDDWKGFRKAKAKYDASYYEGGTMQSMVYSNSMTSTTNEKIQSLRNEHEIILRKFTSSRKGGILK